jgi:SNF family Na+-dependent transporter
MKKPRDNGEETQRADRPIASVDRASLHEETRFAKRQQWNVTAAGLALLGGILTVALAPSLKPLAPFEKSAGLFILFAIPLGCTIFICRLQYHLSEVRLKINADDQNPLTRGWEAVLAFISAVVVGAFIVGDVLLR